ncbi:MAG: hypothetical protein AAF705_00905 [Bacteroidota bacterium]
MKRRDFIHHSLAASVALSTYPSWSLPKAPKREKSIAAYYLRAGMFTQNPDNLKRDLDLMQKWGTDTLCISMHYMQLKRALLNTDRIAEETRKRGMQFFIIPARVAGLTAASPIVSFFTAYHPEALSLKKDGTPHLRRNQGPIGSFYHPKTKEYVQEFVLEIIDKWDVDGLIWDEPKCTWWQDFSPLALENNSSGNFRKYMQDMAEFFSKINLAIKAKKQDCTIVHFDEAVRRIEVVEESAKITPMDYFGCDGKPWPITFPKSNPKGTPKNLFKNGQRYLKQARSNQTGTMYLVENFNLDQEKNDLLERYLPEVINMDIDMLGYYFYGSGLTEPKQTMKITAKNLKKFKQKK